MLEVDAIAGTHLDHPSARARQQLPPQLPLPKPAVASTEAVKVPREQGILELLIRETLDASAGTFLRPLSLLRLARSRSLPRSVSMVAENNCALTTA